MHDLHSSNLSLIPFDYAGKSIRVIIDDLSNPWWVAVDVCLVLGYVNARMALARLDDDERCTIRITDNLIKQGLSSNNPGTSLNLVNEYGLYRLIFTSHKPAAKAFRRFVTDHFLPELNRKGYYVSPSAQHRFAGVQSNDSNPMETLQQLHTETIRSFSKLIDLHDAIYQQGRNAAISGATSALRQISSLDLNPILSAFREHGAYHTHQDSANTEGLQRRHTAPLRNFLDVSIGCPPPRPQNAAERKESPLREASMHSGQNEGEEKTTSPADTHAETDHSADAQPHAVIMTKAKDTSKSEPQDTASLKKTIKTAKPGEDQRSMERIARLRNTRKLQTMIDISNHYHDLLQRRKAGEPFPGGRTCERTASTFAVGIQTVKRANRLVRAITRIERINPRARDAILAGQLTDAIMNLSPAVEAMNHSELSAFAAALADGKITDVSAYQRTMADIPAAIAETEINTHPSSTPPMADSTPPKQGKRTRRTRRKRSQRIS